MTASLDFSMITSMVMLHGCRSATNVKIGPLVRDTATVEAGSTLVQIFQQGRVCLLIDAFNAAIAIGPPPINPSNTVRSSLLLSSLEVVVAVGVELASEAATVV